MYMTEQEEIEKFKKEIGLTTNLLSKVKEQGGDIFSYLENSYYKNRLDKCYYAVLSYKLYELYSNKKYKRQIYGNEWEDYSKKRDSGYCSFYRLFNREDGVILSGEVLNSSTGMLSKYKEDIDGKENISNIAKMYFNLVTTIGNVMPWPLNYNYRPINKELDIVQTKYQYYIGLYGKVNNAGIDKESWIKAFVEGHYLQDFVTDDMTRATEFLNLDKVCKQKDDSLQNWVENILNKKNDSPEDDIEKEWNLYFYRCSKAIMKRSYRILKTEEIKGGELSEEQEKEFEKNFIQFCNECRVKDELVKLKEYLSEDGHEDRMIKDNEVEELEKLINELN